MIFYDIDKPEQDLLELPTALDGAQYFLRLKYVARFDRWNLDILNVDKVVIATGIKLVPDLDLLEGRISLRLPQGRLKCSSNLDVDTFGDVDRDRFGNVFKLFYLTEAEVEAIKAQAAFFSPLGAAIR